MRVEALRDDGRLPILRLAISPITVNSRKKSFEAVGFVDEVAIGAIGLGGEVFHRGQILGLRLGRLRLQQGGFERGRGEDLEIAPAELRIRIFAGDDFALLGDADRALNRARRLGEDRLIAGSAAAADRTAAAMKQAQADIMAPEHFDERHLRFIQFPARGQEAAILVAVGIAEHDLLQAAAAFEQAHVFGQA